jgi:hypothetical protein
MTIHRIKDRGKLVRSGALACVSGIAVTFQNNSLGWVAADGSSSAREHRVLRATQATGDKAPWS